MSLMASAEKFVDDGDNSESTSLPTYKMSKTLSDSPNAPESISTHSRLQTELRIFGQKENNDLKNTRDLHEPDEEIYSKESRSYDVPVCGWKEQRCSSRKRVSPVCDILADRECKVLKLVETQDNHFGLCEPYFKINTTITDADQNGGQCLKHVVFREGQDGDSSHGGVPLSALHSTQNKVVGDCGEKEGHGWNISRDHKAEGKQFSKESRRISNRVELVAFASMKHIKVEDGNEDSLEVPVLDLKTPCALKDTGIKKEVVEEGTCVLPGFPSQNRVSPNRDFLADSGHELGKTQYRHLGQCEADFNIHEAVVTETDQSGGQPIQQVFFRNDGLLEMPVLDAETPSAWEDTGIKKEVIDEGTSLQPYFPTQYQVPSYLGRKAQSCLLSPVFDFLSDCGHYLPGLGEIQDGHLGQYEADFNIPEFVVTDANQNGGQPIQHGVTFGNDEFLKIPELESIIPSAWEDTGIKKETVDVGTSAQPYFLTHHLVRSYLGGTEQSCPSEKRFSPVCDIMADCGLEAPRVNETQDRYLGQYKSGFNINAVVTDANESEGQPIQHGLVFGNKEFWEMPALDPLKTPSSWGDGDIKKEVVDEGTSVQPCLLTHHLVPSYLCRKTRNELGETQDRHSGQYEADVNIHEVTMTDGNQNGGQSIEHAISGTSPDVLEDPLRSQGGACVQTIQETRLFNKPSKIKREEESSEINNGEQGKGREQSKNNAKECTSVIKDKNKKKKSIEISHNMKLPEGSLTGVENSKSLHHYVRRNKCNCSSKSDIRCKVQDTLRLFHAVLRKLVQANETKTQGRVDASIQLIAAAKILKDNDKYVNTKKMLGAVPGVEVGDLFNYRFELAMIGLHRQIQRGIDFINQDGKIIAISIVDSGRYDNDTVDSHVLIYSGQGGNVAGGCKLLQDQKLENGNLALKNSIDKRNMVRVIRGFKERKQIGGRRTTTATYIYDGLYTVERYWHDLGPHGKWTYKFELRRAPNQPEQPMNKVKREKHEKQPKKARKSKKREACNVNDISKGKEKFPICAVNTIDNEKSPPFTYITEVMYPDWCQLIPPEGCDCKDGCSSSKHCACSIKNGGEIPYNYSGAIVEEKSLVYECGPSCKCPPTCHNRVSQHGIKHPLEIFKTESNGWGLRPLSSIASGSFVCEYIGELLDDNDAEQRTDNNAYLFGIGQYYNDLTLREGLSALIPDMPLSCTNVVENAGFTLDAAKFANVGRFINHSCSPNLFAQNVLYDSEDKSLPHIMFFAAQNIPPLQELTYHYNHTVDQVIDSSKNIKKKSCACCSNNCTCSK
ncbi:histone-lysine N-methyltransferase, H3 lysine-9 specific SUVH6-like [Amaranthus tricolor]|uniref:histone-lysine N-methyltransferase, H3 lysine-9 specific SUVH6-like n=1 Tax=Amaranthus tricolor TaxID=29722 RepID=UPI00258B3C19|nr:histone-lysine N-methyltransferase, H3 lysine-9 specific SUVH6-like [Amaranthus tricolor]XP_057519725.1 histone-lysine N-methyltransferase, H3 lysine-9 specific SUVH6-like [Amaranthus tricolor]